MKTNTYLSHIIFHDGSQVIMQLSGLCKDFNEIEILDKERENLYFTKDNWKHKNTLYIYVPTGQFFNQKVYKPMYGDMGTLVYEATFVTMWGHIYKTEYFKEQILTAFGERVYSYYNKLILINRSFTLQQVADLCAHNVFNETF